MFALLLAGLERAQRGKAGTATKGQRFDMMERQTLTGWGAALACALCLLPVCVGFGIKSADVARDIAAVADGAVVGSAIVSEISQGKANAQVLAFVKSLADGAHSA